MFEFTWSQTTTIWGRYYWHAHFTHEGIKDTTGEELADDQIADVGQQGLTSVWLQSLGSHSLNHHAPLMVDSTLKISHFAVVFSPVLFFFLSIKNL